MVFDPHDGVAELDRHLNRLKRSAEALDFAFDRHVARNDLQAATFRAGPSLIRLLLSRSGAIAIELRPPPETAAGAGRSGGRAAAGGAGRFPAGAQDQRPGLLRFGPRASGAFEVLFRDEAGYLTEGSFTSLFVERGGKLLRRRCRAACCRASCASG